MSMLTQKGEAEINFKDERTNKVLGRILSYAKIQMQESGLHFRKFSDISVMTKGWRLMRHKVEFYPEDHGKPLFLHENVII